MRMNNINKKPRRKLFSENYSTYANRLKYYPRRSPNGYKSFGPWSVTLLDEAKLDIDPSYFSKKDEQTIENIIDYISNNPYNLDEYNIHPLWDWDDKNGMFSVWSADINKKDRLVYFVFKDINSIVVTNVREHYILDRQYYK